MERTHEAGLDADGTEECTEELRSNITRAGKRFGGFEEVIFRSDGFVVIGEFVLHGKRRISQTINHKEYLTRDGKRYQNSHLHFSAALRPPPIMLALFLVL